MGSDHRPGLLALVVLGGAGLGAACGTDPEASQPVASVSVTPAVDTIRSGTTTQLTATLRDADGNELNGRTVNWASDNAGIAVVDGSGLVTGTGNGTTTITVTAETISGTAAITAWNGMTGTWSGLFEPSQFFACHIVMTVDENNTRVITGGGNIDDATDGCIDGRYSVDGDNYIGGVADSVGMRWTASGGNTVPMFNIVGRFDGVDTFTGEIDFFDGIIGGGSCSACLTTLTRSSVIAR